MTDAVKMAIEALIKANKALPNPSAKTGKFAEIRADIAESLAALEQAGEPVADDWGTPPDPDGHMSKNAVVEALDMMVEHWVQGTKPTDEQGKQATAALMSVNREAPLPTLQRLGQEFDAGKAEPDAFLYEKAGERFVALHKKFGVEEWMDEDRSRWTDKGFTETPLYAHPPQSRGQAFDGEGEARRVALIERLGTFGDLLSSDPLEGEKGDVAYDLIRQAAAQISSDRQRLAALSSAKRGEEG